MQHQMHCASRQQHNTHRRSSSGGGSSSKSVFAARPPPASSRARQHPCWQAAVAASSSSASQEPQPPEPTAPAPAAPAAAAAAANADDAVARARRDLADSWALLRDAAGQAFVPGYNKQQQGTAARAAQPLRYSDVIRAAAQAGSITQQQEAESLSGRLGRLLSGQFVRDREARSRGSGSGGPDKQQRRRQQNPAETQFAAMQFEVQQRFKQQQQPQPDAASVNNAAPAVTVGADGVIDVTPDSATQQPSAAASSAADEADDTETGGDAPAASGFYPAATQVLVVLMWGVFALQWVQALPVLWEAVTGGRLLEAAAFVLLAFPDTPATSALCLDLPSLAQGQQGWGALLTSGLCHSGLAATYLCCAALQSCGRWLEAGSGQLQLLTVFLISAVFASVAHIFAGGCALGVTGAGAVLGVYTTWSILATRYMSDVVPLRTVYTQGAVLLLLMLALGLIQPAQSAASVVGGVLGGAVAAVIAGPVSHALRWCLALPVMSGLLLVRLLIDLLQALWYVAVLAAAAAWQLVTDVVKTVRGL